jgi:galactonate dehydratase
MYQDGQISDRGEKEGYEIVAAVRDAVGPSVEVLIDAHGHYNVPTAIRLANTLHEQSKIAWFEEPVPPESFDALRAVKENTSAPICVGERLFTRYDFIPVFRDRLADFVMPDTIWTGGITESKKIASMAETYYVPVAPHVVPGGPLELIAAAHVVSSIPNFYRLEHSQAQIPSHLEMLEEPYMIKDGHLHLNGKPGLGYELSEDWLKAHSHPDWNG